MDETLRIYYKLILVLQTRADFNFWNISPKTDEIRVNDMRVYVDTQQPQYKRKPCTDFNKNQVPHSKEKQNKSRKNTLKVLYSINIIERNSHIFPR